MAERFGQAPIDFDNATAAQMLLIRTAFIRLPDKKQDKIVDRNKIAALARLHDPEAQLVWEKQPNE